MPIFDKRNYRDGFKGRGERKRGERVSFFFSRFACGVIARTHQILSLPCNNFLPEVGVETRVVAALVAASLPICFNYQLEDGQRSFVSFFTLSSSSSLFHLFFFFLFPSTSIFFFFNQVFPRGKPTGIINLETLSFEFVPVVRFHEKSLIKFI